MTHSRHCRCFSALSLFGSRLVFVHSKDSVVLPQNDVHTEYIRKKSPYETHSWLGLARPPEADLDGVGICEVAAVVPNPVFPSTGPLDHSPVLIFLQYQPLGGTRSGENHSRQCSSPSSPDTPHPQVVLPTRQFSSSRSPATPRTTLAPPRRQFSASSSPATLRTRVAYQIALSPAFRALDTHDLRRGLRGQPANRTLACISRTRHARSPQRVARAAGKSHSRLHFAHSTRTISAEGCAGTRHIALSPAFRALDTHDLRRGLRAQPANRTLAFVSRTRHARSPQRVARTPGKSHSRLHFAHSTRTISAEGCARTGQIALSPAFRALDTHDLRRGLRADRTNRTLACISRTPHARSPQRVALSVDAVRPTLRL